MISKGMIPIIPLLWLVWSLMSNLKIHLLRYNIAVVNHIDGG